MDRGLGLEDSETAEYRSLNLTKTWFWACLAHMERTVGVDRHLESPKSKPLG